MTLKKFTDRKVWPYMNEGRLESFQEIGTCYLRGGSKLLRYVVLSRLNGLKMDSIYVALFHYSAGNYHIREAGAPGQTHNRTLIRLT